MPAKKLTSTKDSIPAEQSPLARFRKIFEELPQPKGGLPSMPTRIADLASDELGNLMSRYSAWREYTEDRHLEACAAYAQLKSEYDLECDKEMLKSSEDTAKGRYAEARTSKVVTALYNKLTEAEIYMNLFSQRLESFSNTISTISRELTRRGVDITSGLK